MTYDGGKNGSGVFQLLINRMPPHRVYIEPFLGSGAIMRLKRPAALNIGLDKDARVIPPLASADAATDGGGDPPATTGVARSSITSSDVTRRVAPKTALPPGHFTTQDALPFLRNLARVLTKVGHFQGYSPREILVYCDPPYLKSTRRQGKDGRDLYRFELTDREHKALLRTLTQLPCNVMLSGYWSELYAEALADWNAISFQTSTRCGIATEWLWSNFAPPTALHDYTYIGEGYRERERIRKRKKRLIRRLKGMPMLERQALLSAISEAWPTPENRPARSRTPPKTAATPAF